MTIGQSTVEHEYWVPVTVVERRRVRVVATRAERAPALVTEGMLAGSELLVREWHAVLERTLRVDAKGVAQHGTMSMYNRRPVGCRCEECRAESRADGRRRLAARVAAGLPVGDPRHGTQNGYNNWRCRCVECKGWRSS